MQTKKIKATANYIDSTTQIAALQSLTTKQLKKRFEELFERPTRSNDKKYLIKKLTSRIEELAENAIAVALKQTTPMEKNKIAQPNSPPISNTPPDRDPRIPPVGTVLCRTYKGEVYEARVLENCFEYNGQHFKTLSGIARKITKKWVSGYSFFKLSVK